MTRAVVGLGNPGPRFRHTRHNVGWEVVDTLAARLGAGKPVRARHAEVQRAIVQDDTLLLVKPQTFMNESGLAVRALVDKDYLPLDALLVIYDDLDLAFGKLRLRPGGSSGGHNGIRSIQQHLGDREGDFARVKIGIGRPPPGIDPVEHVLRPFLPDERPAIEETIARAADAVECWLRDGIEAAMNRYNGG